MVAESDAICSEETKSLTNHDRSSRPSYSSRKDSHNHGPAGAGSHQQYSDRAELSRPRRCSRSDNDLERSRPNRTSSAGIFKSLRRVFYK